MKTMNTNKIYKVELLKEKDQLLLDRFRTCFLSITKYYNK